MVNATTRPFYLREKDQLAIVQEAGWASRLDWTGVENLAPTKIRSPDRPASSESLYRLSYPGPRPRESLEERKYTNAGYISSDHAGEKKKNKKERNEKDPQE